jgi:hypothetical protein
MASALHDFVNQKGPIMKAILANFGLLVALVLASEQSLAASQTSAAKGPLRIHPDNPRYFTDGTKMPDGSLKAVYLTGAHTWNNLVDMGRSDPPEKFDFEAYLNFLTKYDHNFIRLWAWDSTVSDTRGDEKLGKDFIHHAAPQPWARTGPGNAVDGKPRFDLTNFDPTYFDRLRGRVAAAGERGIYVSVMLFEGWGLFHSDWRQQDIFYRLRFHTWRNLWGLLHGNRRQGPDDGWAWRNHPFNPANNINGAKVTGAEALSGRVHTLRNPEVNKLQAAYIRKVVDTLNDLDNVLYEVINEGGEKEWNWWVIQTIHDHQRTKSKQHPIGNTGHGAERVASLLASPAQWISPGHTDGFAEDPPAWNEKKVSLLDTDHIWGVGGNAQWVWKSFLRGHNPIFMDPYDGSVAGEDRGWEPIRAAMGHTRRLARRINLAAMTPQNDLASTKYCLAHPGREYLVYQPAGGKEFSVELKRGTYRFEWFRAAHGAADGDGRIEVQGTHTFKAPFEGEAVLHLKAAPE